VIEKRHYAGLFLLSVAMLVLELSLTRILSVALWYHFSFLVISTALLGFGSAGVTLAMRRDLRQVTDLDRTLSLFSLGFGLITTGSFWLMQRIPFDPFSLFVDRRQLLFMPAYYVAIAAPFYCGGMAVGLLLTRGSGKVNRLYAVDLVGAGLGCASVALLMPAFGGSGSVLVAVTLGFVAAAAFGLKTARTASAISGLLAVAAFASSFAADHLIPIRVTSNKSNRERPIFSGWNTISKVDVYEGPAQATPAGEPGYRTIIIDAETAATGISDLRPDVRSYLAKWPKDSDYPSGVAYIGKSRPKLLVIGPGAGAQVLDGLHFGARSITAVEINPIIVDLISNRMNDYWGKLFHQPEIHLVTEEGRSFVRRSRDHYDAIISSHTISNAAVASGALSLAENYVLTQEAFEDYLDHLEDDGVLYFTRPETQIARLFSTAREVLKHRGVPDISSQVFAYRWAAISGPEAGHPAFRAAFLLKKSPWTQVQLDQMRGLLSSVHNRTTRAEVLYAPDDRHPGSIYQTLAATNDLPAVYAANAALLVPATDDRPFFNQHERWSSIRWAAVSDVFQQGKKGRTALEERPVAEVTLLVLLVQVTVIAAVLILLPLIGGSREGASIPGRWSCLTYFSTVGFGFILIEIAMLQQFTLFLGQPVYTLAAILASILVFTGIGSALSERWAQRSRKALLRAIPVLLLLLLLTAMASPLVFRSALALPLPWRIAIAILLVAPLGVVLGAPFPLGLRLVSERSQELVPWAWGINGFFTVLGSICGLIFGMAFGFHVVLLIAGVCYLLAYVSIAMGRSVCAEQAVV
jgi:hypothetical protein